MLKDKKERLEYLRNYFKSQRNAPSEAAFGTPRQEQSIDFKGIIAEFNSNVVIEEHYNVKVDVFSFIKKNT